MSEHNLMERRQPKEKKEEGKEEDAPAEVVVDESDDETDTPPPVVKAPSAEKLVQECVDKLRLALSVTVGRDHHPEKGFSESHLKAMLIPILQTVGDVYSEVKLWDNRQYYVDLLFRPKGADEVADRPFVAIELKYFRIGYLEPFRNDFQTILHNKSLTQTAKDFKVYDLASACLDKMLRTWNYEHYLTTNVHTFDEDGTPVKRQVITLLDNADIQARNYARILAKTERKPYGSIAVVGVGRVIDCSRFHITEPTPKQEQ